MKTSKKSLVKLAVFFLLTIFTVSSCVPVENDPEPAPTNNTPATDSYLDADAVTKLHIIGSSPCPQKVTDVKIFCGKADSCTADSAVITNPNTGLDISFENGKSSIALDSNPLESKTITVDFNCQVAMSFKHTYKIILYKNGVKVGEQDLEINMTVQ